MLSIRGSGRAIFMSVKSKRVLAFKARKAVLMTATAVATSVIIFPTNAADVTIASGSTVGQ